MILEIDNLTQMVIRACDYKNPSGKSRESQNRLEVNFENLAKFIGGEMNVESEREGVGIFGPGRSK